MNKTQNSTQNTHELLPRRVLAWAVMRASTNTLATPENLSRGVKQVDTKCALEGCNSTCILGHMFSGCSKSLDRFAQRHDSVLALLLKTINQHKGEDVETYADLNGHRIHDGTIPPNRAATGLGGGDEESGEEGAADRADDPVIVNLVSKQLLKGKRRDIPACPRPGGERMESLKSSG